MVNGLIQNALTYCDDSDKQGVTAKKNRLLANILGVSRYGS